MILRVIISVLLMLSYAVPAIAHEMRPGYLELTETAEHRFSVTWKVPMKGDAVMRLSPELPAHCTEQSPPSRRMIQAAMLKQWSVICPGGISPGVIHIDGLRKTLTDVLVRIEYLGGTTQTTRLTGLQPGFTVSGEPSSYEVVLTYLTLGIEHILLGIDHLLFVLALLFLVRSWPRLIGTVTSFTLAHSLTLAAAALNWVQVPQAPVEAVIALSIMFVAIEVLHARKGRIGLAARMPWVVAFIFGLLHGFGFAGALNEIGLPENAIPLALAFFNIGVEIGQLLFIAAFFIFMWLVSKLLHKRFATDTSLSPTWAATARLSFPVAYVIGSLAAYWLIERTVSFWA